MNKAKEVPLIKYFEAFRVSSNFVTKVEITLVIICGKMNPVFHSVLYDRQIRHYWSSKILILRTPKRSTSPLKFQRLLYEVSVRSFTMALQLMRAM